MNTHSTRIITVSLTINQTRALRSAVALTVAHAAELLFREQSLLPLTRGWEAIEAAWKAGRPDYGDAYRRAHSPCSGAQDLGQEEAQ
jgi:hypothetical protein